MVKAINDELKETLLYFGSIIYQEFKLHNLWNGLPKMRVYNITGVLKYEWGGTFCVEFWAFKESSCGVSNEQLQIKLV